jgi:hypothetical protein
MGTRRVWIELNAAHDFQPRRERRLLYAYRAGDVRPVTRECAEQVVRLGRGRLVKTPSKAQAEAIEAAGWRYPEGMKPLVDAEPAPIEDVAEPKAAPRARAKRAGVKA